MDIAILTAALNEEVSLPPLIRELSRRYDVYVVDDGSSDGTEQAARSSGAMVIRHSLNLGQGYAMITGIKAILSASCRSFDYIVYLDADGQHDPSEVPLFIRKAEDEGLDVVVGSRVLGSDYKDSPLFRRMFLPLFTAVINRLTGYQLTDAMCGFRLFRVSSLRKILPVFDHMLEPQYLASEMFIRFAKAGLSVGEVPVRLRPRLHGASRKGLFRYGYGIIRAIILTLSDRNYRVYTR